MGAARKTGVVVTIGLLTIIASGLLLYFFPEIIEGQVAKSLNLEMQKDLSYENWATLSLPLSMKFFFFHVENPDDVVNHGAKPKLVEKGPYIFSETREKVGLTWNETDHTVSYYQLRNYTFVRSESIGDLSDNMTIANVPAIAIATMGKGEDEKKQKLLGSTMSTKANQEKTGLYRTKTVGEWLFDGYFDSFIKMAQEAANKTMLPNHTFGFFYGFNGADDGRYTVYTGKDDVSKYTVIKEWRGPRHIFPDVDSWARYDKVPMWNSTHCSDINGTDGQQFPPFVKKDSRLRIFISEMCRSAYVVFQKEVTHHGITAYRFVPDVNMMADPSVNPDNECFCETKQECMFTGAISIRKCQRDAPIYATFPHFYQADPLLLKTVDGLKPDPEKHTILLDVEPLTGTPINAKRCSQVNVDMEPMAKFYPGTDQSKMPRMYHPVLWFCEEGTLNEGIAEKFKEMAVTPVRIGTTVIYALLGVGIALVVGAFGVYCLCRAKKNSSMSFSLQMRHLETKENIYGEVKSTGNGKIDEKFKKY